MRMHADQVELAPAVVARLVLAQFPQWGGLPVRPIVSDGTVNALFRLGPDIVLRFPLRPGLDPAMAEALRQEQENARRIEACTELLIPEPLGLGRPGEGYAGPWTVYRWITGQTVGVENIGEPVGFARDLAQFVRDLRGLDTGGRAWDGRTRGGPLSSQADDVSDALAHSTHLVDVPRIAQVWERCLAAPVYRGSDVWIHADLMPGNLLIRDGRLAAVIDLGAMGIGDPEVDLMPAWNLLSAQARDAYRRALDVDDASWERGRGWALAQAIVALPYYLETNPVMAETARRTLDAVL